VGQTEVTHAEPTWVPNWSDFRAQARRCAERAAAELEECWRDQWAIGDSCFESFDCTWVPAPTPPVIENMLRVRAEAQAPWLERPASVWERRRTLWILSVNAVAFRFLNAAVQLGASFSHRINAASATQADLERAIMQRHNLSGLRLPYAAPPPEGGLLRRARPALYGRDPDPQYRFFWRPRGRIRGVFRTACDIWLRHIEAIEAGVLYMKLLQPSICPTSSIRSRHHDLFTLAAILQRRPTSTITASRRLFRATLPSAQKRSFSA
jgi:hypothetical protein